MGELVEVSAVTGNRNDQVTVIETGEVVNNYVAGQVAFIGRFADGAVASVSLHGGSAPGPDGFLLKIAGTAGTLTVTPGSGAYVGWADWLINVTPVDGPTYDLTIPDSYRVVPASVPGGPARNVAALYREIAQAINEGRPARPDFHIAARHHRTLAAIERSAQLGMRQSVSEVALV